jgi:hypothetical protein
LTWYEVFNTYLKIGDYTNTNACKKYLAQWYENNEGNDRDSSDNWVDMNASFAEVSQTLNLPTNEQERLAYIARICCFYR